jgi:hypothetical protein
VVEVRVGRDGQHVAGGLEDALVDRVLPLLLLPPPRGVELEVLLLDGGAEHLDELEVALHHPLDGVGVELEGLPSRGGVTKFWRFTST